MWRWSQMWHSRAEPCCMYIAIYYVQKNGGKVPQPKRPQLIHFVPGHDKDIFTYIHIHIYIYIYVCVCVCVLYLNLYIYIFIFIYLFILYTISISTSLWLYVCMFTPFSIRNCRFLCQMDAAGFEPAGGGEGRGLNPRGGGEGRGAGYRFEMEKHFQPGGPETSSAWKIMRAVSSPGNTLLKQIRLQQASFRDKI